MLKMNEKWERLKKMKNESYPLCRVAENNMIHLSIAFMVELCWTKWCWLSLGPHKPEPLTLLFHWVHIIATILQSFSWIPLQNDDGRIQSTCYATHNVYPCLMKPMLDPGFSPIDFDYFIFFQIILKPYLGEEEHMLMPLIQQMLVQISRWQPN